jgi:hypothetical protein
MKWISIGSALAMGLAAVGCSNSGPPPQNVQHWLEQVPVGAPANQAKQTLAENRFETWNSGRVVYAYRDPDFPIANSDGVSLHVYLNPDNRVLAAEGEQSPKDAYPLLLPVYP